jgi:hypothetical protein
LENSLLYSDKELGGIPSSAGSFDLDSCISSLWEALIVVYIGRSTSMLFWILHLRIWGYQTQSCPCRTMVDRLEIDGFLLYPPWCMVQILEDIKIYL